MMQHKKHVKEVLRRLHKNGLYVAAPKCEFHKESVEYLGFIISIDSLRMAQDKVQIILDWPEPRRVKDVQSFLRFCNFYQRFIFGYSDIVIPLIHLTRKNFPWKFNKKCCMAFDQLKEEFTCTPILTKWLPDSKMIVETDASDYPLAAIISSWTPDSKIHPIAFHSHSFNSAELNYDTHDK